jgi:LuxR family transcriptional regulator, maltose regulon positive regulatory protein
MPRVPLHALTWSREQNLYELYTQGQLGQRFRPAEEAAWLAWLREVSSFAFHSPGGSLNVYLERRPRGGAYWYAYHTSQGRTRKRYLGRTETLSLAHLEEIAQTLLREQQPTQALERGMLVLSGRLAPPRLPNALVEREHLLSALDGALATPLTLLSASAGWGKTTLLSAWTGRHTAQVAWLSLDELDNSPTRFWVSLIAALRHCGGYAPSFGETAVALLESPQPPSPSTILTALLQELEGRSAHPAPIVLIVDDYQVIEEQAIHQGMSFFLEHLPASVHLILASRVDPDLKPSRLRVRGQLTEIRASDLRFQEVEASQYLGQMLSPPL